MPSADSTEPHQPARRGWFDARTRLATIAVLLGVALYVGRDPLLIQPLARRALERLERERGLELTYASFETEGIGSLRFSEARMTLRDEGGDTARLDADLALLRLDFDAWNLLTGDGLDAVQTIHAVDGAVFVDLSTSSLLDDRPRPEDFPPLQLDGLDLELRLPAGRALGARGLSLNLNRHPDGRRATLSTERLRTALTAERALELEQVELDLTLGSGAVWLEEIAVGGERRAVDARFELGPSSRLQRMQLELPLSAGGLTATLDVDGGRLAGSISIRSERLYETLSREQSFAELALGRPLDGLDRWIDLDGRLRTDFDFALSAGLDGRPTLELEGRLDEAALEFDALEGRTLGLRGDYEWRRGRIETDLLEVQLGESRGRLESARLAAPWDAADVHAWLTESSARFEIDLAPGSLPREAGLHTLEEWLGPWSAAGEGRLATGSPTLAFDRAELTFGGGELRLEELALTPSASGSGSPWSGRSTGRLAIDAPGALSGRLATVGWNDGRGELEFAGERTGEGLTASGQGQIEAPRIAGYAADAVTVNARLDTSSEGRGTLELTDLQAAVGSDRLDLDGVLALDLRALDAARWESLGGTLEVDDLGSWVDEAPHFRVDARLDGDGPFAAPDLGIGLSWTAPAAESPGEARLGAGSALLRWSGRQLTVEQLEQSLGLAEIRATGTAVIGADPDPWSARLDTLTVLDVDAERGALLDLEQPVLLDAELLDGRRDGRLALVGDAGSVAVTRIESGWDLDLEAFDGALLPSQLVPRALRLGRTAGGLRYRARGGGSVDLELESEGARLEVPGGVLVAGNARLDAELGLEGPNDTPASGRIELSIDGLESRGLWPGDLGLAPGALDLALEVEPDAYLVSRLEADLPGRVRTDLTGRVERDGWAPHDLDLSGAFACDDLAIVRTLAPDVRVVDGGFELDTLAVSGPIAAPRLDGQGRVAIGLLQFDDTLPTVRDLAGPFAIADSQLVIAEWTAQSGSAPIALSGAVALPGADDLEGGASGERLALDLGGSNALLWRSRRWVVRGDLDLRLGGTLTAPRLSGDVQLTNTRYRREFGGLGAAAMQPKPTRSALPLRDFAVSGGPLAPVALDVRIESDVDDPILVSTEFGRASLRPELSLSGTLGDPRLLGFVGTDPTQIPLPDSTLRLAAGRILFPEEKGAEPTLELRGQTRIAGYDLTLTIDGPARAPRMEITSVPPLSTEDAARLLASGQAPDGSAASTSGIQASEMLALYVSSDLGDQVFGNAGDDRESLLDRFEAEVGRDISRLGRPTIEVSFRLLDELLVERDSLHLAGERDRYEDVNGGLRLVFRFE